MQSHRLLGILMGFVLILAGCGGGSSTTVVVSPPPPPVINNVQPIVIDSGPAGAGSAVNEAYITVTICSPNSPTTCQTIDHILVDTGSYGLRVLSSVLTIPLQQETDGANAIVECTPFGAGYSWGPVQTANLQIAGENATALPIQVIGDPNFSAVPQSCSSVAASPANTVEAFRANGVFGIGAFAQDCGMVCVQNVIPAAYYSCDSSGNCQEISLSLEKQVANPITFFAKDNNGEIINMPSLNGLAQTVTGNITFGVGTQANNGLGSAKVYTIDPSTGYFTTTYQGTQYTYSFIDSGSNGNYFYDPTIPTCPNGSGFYCPTNTLSLSATNTGTNGTTSSIDFQAGNASNLQTGDAAYSLLAGPNNAASFDWGMPFFFGRSVYYVIQDDTAGGQTGPFYAY